MRESKGGARGVWVRVKRQPLGSPRVSTCDRRRDVQQDPFTQVETAERAERVRRWAGVSMIMTQNTQSKEHKKVILTRDKFVLLRSLGDLLYLTSAVPVEILTDARHSHRGKTFVSFLFVQCRFRFLGCFC